MENIIIMATSILCHMHEKTSNKVKGQSLQCIALKNGDDCWRENYILTSKLRKSL